MAPKPTTIGGGSARGVSDDFSKLLQQALGGGFNTAGGAGAMGNFGRANPMGSTMNVGDALGALLSGGQGLSNGALSIANNRRQEDVANLRSQYALGGTGFGTPAATAESRFLGEFDPQVATQVGGMQLDSIGKALSFIFPSLQQAYGLGTPQAQTVMQPSGFSQALSGIEGIAGAAAPFFAPGIGSLAKAGISGLSGATSGSGDTGGQLGQSARYNFDGSHTDRLDPGVGNAWNGYGSQRNTFGQPWWLQ